MWLLSFWAHVSSYKSLLILTGACYLLSILHILPVAFNDSFPANWQNALLFMVPKEINWLSISITMGGPKQTPVQTAAHYEGLDYSYNAPARPLLSWNLGIFFINIPLWTSHAPAVSNYPPAVQLLEELFQAFCLHLLFIVMCWWKRRWDVESQSLSSHCSSTHRACTPITPPKSVNKRQSLQSLQTKSNLMVHILCIKMLILLKILIMHPSLLLLLPSILPLN